MQELNLWLSEVKRVFPKLIRKSISVDYKSISKKKLGYVKAKIEQKLDFDAESLLLGQKTEMKKQLKIPSDYKIFINQELLKIKNTALRRQIVQHILIHELLHIENHDLITLSKDYNRRKQKKIHLDECENEIFKRFNQLRALDNIMEIEKREHLEIAISRILEGINWFEKK